MNKKYDIYEIDKDALFAKISERIDSNSLSPEETDFSAFDTENIPENRSPRINIFRSFIGAAAAIIIMFAALPVLMSLDSSRISDSADNSPYDAAEESYEEPYDDDHSEDIAEEEPETQQNTVLFEASSGWEYSSVSLSAAESYSDSDIEGILPYESASKGSTVNDLFSEETILGNTDFFLDCRVIDYRVDFYENEITFYYTVKPIHTVSDTDLYLPEEMVIRSGSAYILRADHEYLIPVKIDPDGEYEAADKSSPQTEITEERLVVFHNGWKELRSGEYERLDLSPVKNELYISEDDFFYDRLNITSESELQALFDAYLYK